MDSFDLLDPMRRQMEELRKQEELLRPIRQADELRRQEELLRPFRQAEELRRQEEMLRPFREMEEHHRLATLIPEVPDFTSSVRHIHAVIEAQTEAAEAPTARRAVRHLQQEIQSFESDLDDSAEVGVRLVAFGPSFVVHVTDVGFHQPNLVVLIGALDDGSPVRLVQHLSQLNFLLVRAARLEPETPRRPIGFHYADKDSESAG